MLLTSLLALDLSLGIGMVDQEFEKQRDNPVFVGRLYHRFDNNMEIGIFHASGLLSKKTDGDKGINIIYGEKRFESIENLFKK